MNLEKLNHWLTLCANLAVLIGIFVLVVEIDQNTRAIEYETYWSRVATSAELTAPLTNSEELAAAFFDYSETAGADLVNRSFSDPNAYRVTLILGNMALQNEARFVTQSSSLAEQKTFLLNFLSRPGVRDFFRGRLATFNPEFAAFVQEIIDEIEGR